MRHPAGRPRHDQVAELTRGVRLPLAPITDEHLQILAEGLRQAFDHVRVHAPNAVCTGEEPEVTALMHARLNGMLHEDSLWRQLVLWVGRGAESTSSDRRVPPRETPRPLDCPVRRRSALSPDRGGEDSRRRGVEDSKTVL